MASYILPGEQPKRNSSSEETITTSQYYNIARSSLVSLMFYLMINLQFSVTNQREDWPWSLN